MGNLFATEYIPFAAVPKKYDIIDLSDALTTHHAKLLGIRGIEYVPTLFKVPRDTCFIETYFQHLEAKIKYTRVNAWAINVETNKPCNPIFKKASAITLNTIVKDAEINDTIAYWILCPSPLTNCNNKAIKTWKITYNNKK